MSDALKRLDERFAAGEIDAEEYQERRRLLVENAVDGSAPKELGNGADRGSSGSLINKIGGLVLVGIALGAVLAHLDQEREESIARPGGAEQLKAIELKSEGFFAPEVVATLHNEGPGSYYSFEAQSSDGNVLCTYGRTYFAQGERRTIRFGCPDVALSSTMHRDFKLIWRKE